MVVPALGFAIGVLGFGIVGTIVLWLTAHRRPRFRAVAVFVAAAFVGCLAWSVIFRFAAGTNGKLETTASVIIFLSGLPLAGSVVGWAVAKHFNAPAA